MSLPGRLKQELQRFSFSDEESDRIIGFTELEVRTLVLFLDPLIARLIEDAKQEGAWGGPDWRDHL